MKAKFINHKGTVLLVWTGKKGLGIGKRLSVSNWGCKYSAANHKVLVDHDARFVNRFVDVYDFPGKYDNPRDCQIEMLDFQLRHHRAYNLSEMRTGKSYPVSCQISIDIKYNKKNRIIIFAPLSTLEDTWKSELFSVNTKTPTFYSIHNTDGVKRLKKALKRKSETDAPSIFVVNFDKIWRCEDELLQYVLSGDEGRLASVYIDEASDFNDHKTQKYKSLNKIMSHSPISLLALTGTPVPNRPSDAWAIARLINPATPKNWGHLRNKTMEKHPYSQYKWTPKPEAKEIIGELMQPSIRFRTDDVADMPDHEGLDVSVDMSTKQEKMFAEMKHQMITEDRGKVITAAHAGARLWKLLQIASGVCRDSEGNSVMIGAEPKLQEVKRLIREAPRKTVIMCSFTSVQKYIIKELEGIYRVGHINGGTPTKERKKILDAFQGDGLDVLVCHPRPTRYGLKMHAASQMIWFGPVYSALDFEQGSFRIRGPGTGKTWYIKLSCSPLEREIYALIESRMQDQQGSMDVAKALKQVYSSFFEET